MKDEAKHQQEVENEAIASLKEITLSGDWLGSQAKVVIDAIKENKIKHVSINY